MKKILFLTILILNTLCFFGQDITENDSIPDGWNKTGKITFLFNQSAFSNWQAGGDNSFAGNIHANYDFNFKKGDLTIDNKLMAGYGLTNTKDQGTRKTDDRLEFNSVLGKKFKKRKYWSGSFFMNFKTQFTKAYDYTGDFVGDNKDYPSSGMFKPAYVSFGPGLLWKKNGNLMINISPMAAKFTFIFGEIFKFNDNTKLFESSEDVEIFGVDPGESSFAELGFNLRAYYKLDLMKNINMENILTLHSNYLEKPQNVDLDYAVNLVMKINDILSTNLTFQTIYDDNAYSGFQVREIFGIGFNYIF